jgi:hypothetical protein
MVLGGAMFKFEKLNKLIGGGHQVPIIADMMTSRWAYEALTVAQFKNNDFQSQTFDLERMESVVDYKQVYYIPKIEELLEESMFIESAQEDSIREVFNKNVRILKNEITMESAKIEAIDFPYDLNSANFDITMIENLLEYVSSLKEYYNQVFAKLNRKKEKLVNEMQSSPEKRQLYIQLRDSYQNERLTDIVKNIYTDTKLEVIDDKLVQIIDPIFNNPELSTGLNYRAHFYAPNKSIFNRFFDTYVFNMAVIWFFTIILYITLYFESLKKLLSLNFKIKRSK